MAIAAARFARVERLTSMTKKTTEYPRKIEVAEGELVMGTDTTARINQAISLPTVLKAPDGRLFEIRSWEPSVTVESVVSVKVDAIIRMKDSST